MKISSAGATDRAENASTPIVRRIEKPDNAAIAAIIRQVMPEFGASGQGFAITDPEVDHMCEAYAMARAAYFVVTVDGRVMGGCGIAPLAGEDGDVCELRKMYFLPEIRGKGCGQRLLTHCLDTAREFGFRHCYIETLTGMDAAMRLYEKNGFIRLNAPRGATGHFGCDRWYLKKL